MISSRGLDDNAGAARYSEHSAVDDMEHCTADKLIEDHLDREQQLGQQVRILNKQVDELEHEIDQGNEKLRRHEEEAIDAKKQLKQIQRELEQA